MDIGEWEPWRPYAYVNNYNPTILNCLRCNHDIKLLLHSADAADIFWYITRYATKKQLKSANVSALFAKTLSYLNRSHRRSSDVKKFSDQLTLRCSMAVGRMQEFSSAEVISYLMNWGDRYVSHTYVPIYVSGIIASLKDEFPNLR